MNSGGGSEHHSPSSTVKTVVSYFSIKLGKKKKNSEDCQLFTNTVNDLYNFKNLKDTP